MTAVSVDAMIVDLLAEPVTADTLRQDAAHFHGLSSADAERVRAHLLAVLETRGVSPEAASVLAEELRTSVSPVVLAGAARAVRGLADGSATDPAWRGLITDAAARIADHDVFVRWQSGTVSPGWMRTARGELMAARDGLPAASGPDPRRAGDAGPIIVLDAATVEAVEVEDQDGRRSSLEELLVGGTTLLAFFYTRCMNPQKCSLTITRLAAITRGASRSAPRILAVSYDPDFDAPHRLRRYGLDRDFRFGDGARLVRCVDGWQPLRAMLRLQVGYGPTTVNEHAREVFRITPDLIANGLNADALADPGGLVAPA